MIVGCEWRSPDPHLTRGASNTRVRMDQTLLDAAAAGARRGPDIDIVTLGARSGERRTTEIWFTKVGDEIFITGTPAGDGTPAPRRRRDWLANLKAHPEFDFVLKESIQQVLPAVATVITDRDERTRIFFAPETAYYRDNTGSLDRLVDEASRSSGSRSQAARRGSHPGVQASGLLGGDLDEVAAGVVEHGGRDRAHVGRRLGEPHARATQPLVLGLRRRRRRTR